MDNNNLVYFLHLSYWFAIISPQIVSGYCIYVLLLRTPNSPLREPAGILVFLVLFVGWVAMVQIPGAWVNRVTNCAMFSLCCWLATFSGLNPSCESVYDRAIGVKYRSNNPRKVIRLTTTPPSERQDLWDVGIAYGRTLTYPLIFNTGGTSDEESALEMHARASQ